jgi:hypothetical protein
MLMNPETLESEPESEPEMVFLLDLGDDDTEPGIHADLLPENFSSSIWRLYE